MRAPNTCERSIDILSGTRRAKRAREVEKMLRAAIEQNRAHFGRTIDRLKRQRDEARAALEESVKLQSHYARLLNDWDGGERIGFENAAAWIARLREVKHEVR